MKPHNNIEKLIAELVLPGTKAGDERILNDALAAYEKTETEKTAERQPDVWRIIMRSKMTKFAVAAVIILVGMVIVNQFGGSIDGTNVAYGITDIPKLFKSAKTFHVQALVWHYDDSDNWELTTAKMLPQEYWLDLQNHKSWERNYEASSSLSGENRRISLIEQIENSKYIMTVDHTRKLLWYNKNSIEEQKSRATDTVNKFMNMFGADELQKFELVGQERIKGEKFDIWQKYETKDWGTEPVAVKTRCWISPLSGELAKVYKWYKKPNGYWRPYWFIETIERNIKIAPNLFEFKTLENYTHQNKIEDL